MTSKTQAEAYENRDVLPLCAFCGMPEYAARHWYAMPPGGLTLHAYVAGSMAEVKDG